MRQFLGILVGCLLLLSTAALAEVWEASPTGRSLGEALALCQDGDTILLLPGVYDASREAYPLVIDHAITLEAREGAVLDVPQLVSALRIEADGVVLRHLEIGIRHIGLYVTGNDLTVEDCRIALTDAAWRTSSCGVWLGGVQRAVFRDCDFTGCGICMAGPPISEKSAGLPVLTGMFEVGEDRAFFTTHTIDNCRVNGRPLVYITGEAEVVAPAGAGEIICVDCGEVTVVGADCSDASIGIQLTYNENVFVSDCNVSRCGIFGLYISKCGGGVAQNCLADGTNHGFDVRASQNIQLTRCVARNCDQGLFFSLVEHGVMADCEAIATGQGIFTAKGQGNLFLRCRVEDCENGFHLQRDEDALLEDCEVLGCTVCGVRLDTASTTCVGCSFTRNWVGLMAYGDVRYLITNNVFHENQSCGLYLRAIGFSRIGNNIFTGHTRSSVDARNTMSHSLFYANQLDFPLLAQPESIFQRLD